MKKYEFGKYTDITKLAKKTNPALFDFYEKVFICPDTNNIWLSMIQYGVDEDYEECDGYLLERDDIDYYNYDTDASSLDDEVVKEIIDDWDGSVWDTYETDTLEDAIELIDGGWGIIDED